jgi:hypothetical protein
LRKSFDEIHDNVNPYGVGHVEWLQQPDKMKMFCLVPLANQAALDELMHQAVVVRRVEGCSETLQHLLYTLLPNAMSFLQHLRPVARRGWHEHTTLEQDNIIGNSPAFVRRAHHDRDMLGHHLWKVCSFTVKHIK